MGFRPGMAQKQPVDCRRGAMMPGKKSKFGNRGNSGPCPWEPRNLLKLKAGNRGNRGNRKKNIFINVLQTPVENLLRNREIPPCPWFPRFPIHSFNIYFIIILYIYIYTPFWSLRLFTPFGNRGNTFGNRKRCSGNRKTVAFYDLGTFFPGFRPLIFSIIGGNHGAV